MERLRRKRWLLDFSHGQVGRTLVLFIEMKLLEGKAYGESGYSSLYMGYEIEELTLERVLRQA